MMLDWTYQVISFTAILSILFLVFSLWAKRLWKILGILIGLVGIWLMIAEVIFETKEMKVSTEVEDITAFLSSEKAEITDSVLLVGLDHTMDDLNLLDSFVVSFSGPIFVKDGFDNLIYPDRVVAGEEFTIEGSVQLIDSSEVSIVLKEPDGSERRIEIDQERRFEEVLTTSTSGLYTYQISLINATDTITEVIPLEVAANDQFNLLIYASTPQFELNYLKNHWVKQGNGVLQKVQVSSNIYNSSFINMPEKNFSRITKSVLEDFDIVLFDLLAWNGLTSTERSNILLAVENEGLGLILQPLGATSDQKKANGLPFHRVDSEGFSEVEGVKLTLINYAKNRVWSACEYGLCHRLGFGKVFLLQWVDTYKLILQNKSTTYEKIWSSILSEVFSEFTEGLQVVSNSITTAGEWNDLVVIGIQQGDELRLHTLKLPVINTPYLETVGEIRINPDRGWNKIIRQTDTSEVWFYAFAETDRQTMRQNMVKQEVERRATEANLEIDSEYVLHKELPWYLGLLMMLLGFGTVWFYEKLVE